MEEEQYTQRDESIVLFKFVFIVFEAVIYNESNSHGEYGHDTEEGLRAQLNRDKTVLLGLPIGGGGWLQTWTVVLCDDASHCILKLLGKTCELLNAGFDDLLAPLVDFLFLVDNVVWADDLLDGRLSDLFDLLRIEVLIIVEVVHYCWSAFFIFI